MKTFNKTGLLLLTAFLSLPILAQTSTIPSTTEGNSSQNPAGVVLDKYVTGPVNGTYTLTLEAFATGASVTTVTEETDVQPCDIVLVMDVSSSMTSSDNKITVPESKVKLPTGTLLNTSDTYKVQSGSNEYFMKVFFVEGSTTYTSEKVTCNSTNLGSGYYFKYNGEYYPVSVVRGYSNRYYLGFKVDGTQYYVSGASSARTNTNNSNPSSTYYATSATANIVSNFTLYKNPVTSSDTYVYRMKSASAPTSATDGSQFMASTTTAYQVKATDNIYSYTAGGSKTRLAVLGEAAKKFIQTVYDNSPEEGSHNLALVSFAGSATYVYPNTASTMTPVNSQDVVNTLQGRIPTSSSTGTRSDLGLLYAYNHLSADAYKNDGRKKVVVFFTDGCPSTSGGFSFNSTYAQSAVNIAYGMKQTSGSTSVSYLTSNSGNDFSNASQTTMDITGIGATIYSIGLLSAHTEDNRACDAETSGSNLGTGIGNTYTYDIRRFLHYVSSNYSFKIATTGSNYDSDYYFVQDYATHINSTSNTYKCKGEDCTGTGSETSHDFYSLSSGADLTSIFDRIAAEASGSHQGGASITLSATSTTVVDVITGDFKLPDNADVNSISAYSVRLNSASENATTHEVTYSWDTTKTNIAKSNISVDTQNNKIGVTGFDFTKEDTYNTAGTAITEYGNWVGKREVGSTDVWSGAKLVIEIPIVVNQSTYEGGYNTPTNTSGSSIVAQKQDGTIGSVAWFPVPEVDFPTIGIAKWGLDEGESAIFEVKRTKDAAGQTLSTPNPVYRVIVTAGESKSVDITWENEDLTYYYATIKDVPAGTYTVTETAWSWTYDRGSDTPKQSLTHEVPATWEGTTYGFGQFPAGSAPVGNNHAAYISEIDGKVLVVFFWDNVHKDNMPAHGEGAKTNEFNVVNSSTGGNSDDPGLQ